MRMTVAAGALAGVATIGLAMAGQGEAQAAPTGVLIARIYLGTSIDRYLAELIEPVRTQDRDGNGLDPADLDAADTIARAQARASAVSQMLRYDLNGDFKVTRAEIAQTVRRPGAADPDREVNALLGRYDADQDGVITLPEMAGAAGQPERSNALRPLLRLDPNHDGRLTSAELRQLGQAAFAAIDRDGDGVVSEQEYAAARPLIQQAQIEQSTPICTMPAVPAGAQLVAFGSYEAEALSSVAVGGADQETNYMDIVIEPGTKPLYLVLTSYESMVWHLRGATGRVGHVVVSSLQRGGSAVPIASGVIGVPAAAVSAQGCPRYFSASEGPALAQARAAIRNSAGRDPDSITGSYSARSVSLPSGTIEHAARDSAAVPAGFDAAAWNEARRYWPAGLVAVDPRAVVSKASVKPYAVLPSQMGVAQLLGARAIERTSGGAFRIVRPLPHLPPAMGGAHSETFILAHGIPQPPGDPVHACVVREEDVTGGVAAACDTRRRRGGGYPVPMISVVPPSGYVRR